MGREGANQRTRINSERREEFRLSREVVLRVFVVHFGRVATTGTESRPVGWQSCIFHTLIEEPALGVGLPDRQRRKPLMSQAGAHHFEITSIEDVFSECTSASLILRGHSVDVDQRGCRVQPPNIFERQTPVGGV